MTTGQAGSTSNMGNQSSTHSTTHMHAANRHSRGVSNANPNAQNAEVARLNEQSLQAAQQGHTFTPSGAGNNM
ncbi:MAG TPA: hypothetical protein VLI93_07430 [Acetobacteraceae bacterium]|nr:hypothetical protein [Acetobacteraceae bacterium]